MKTLERKAFVGLLQLFLALATVLFAASGTLAYWQAWIFLAAFFLPTLLITLYLLRRDPQLLARRVQAGPAAEKQCLQQVIQGVASLAFFAIFAVSALDRRFGWSGVPAYGVAAGDVLVVAGLCLVFLVFRENSYASATIEVDEGQEVISSGPYAYVRHPMYAGAFVLLLGVPVALGSWWGEAAVVPLIAAIVLRLLDEERYLLANLPGYARYRKKVRYRLVPFFW